MIKSCHLAVDAAAANILEKHSRNDEGLVPSPCFSVFLGRVKISGASVPGICTFHLKTSEQCGTSAPDANVRIESVRQRLELKFIIWVYDGLKGVCRNSLHPERWAQVAQAMSL
jgi:hypothetical protein